MSLLESGVLFATQSIPPWFFPKALQAGGHRTGGRWLVSFHSRTWPAQLNFRPCSETEFVIESRGETVTFLFPSIIHISLFLKTQEIVKKKTKEIFY